MELELWGDCIFDWAPCDPKDGRCHYLLAGTHLIPIQDSTTPSWAGLLQLPAPPGARQPLVVQWHTWCWDDAGNLHLVYWCIGRGELTPITLHGWHSLQCGPRNVVSTGA